MDKRDFTLANHGSICILTPLTTGALNWLDQFVVNSETQFFGRGIVVEPRYVGSIVQHIYADGLSIDGIEPTKH
jgi:hypothetical protein